MAKSKRKKRDTTPKKMAAGSQKIKVVGYCDSPTCATGFGTVSRNVFEGLHNTGKYDIDVLGINYWGDPHDFPYRIWPTGTNAQKDPYGRQKVLNMIPRMDFDILFLLQDSFIMEFVPTLIPHLRKTRAKPFKSILYYPVDSIIKHKWAANIAPADYLVAYSEFGRQETLKRLPDREDIRVVPHGVDSRQYFPVAKDEVSNFRKQYFGPYADHFIITNVNRNQQRKDIPRTIIAFKEFRKIVPNSLLYLHMAIKDQGWDLAEVCKYMDLDITKDVIFPKNFGPNQGYPREVLNLLYNASDVVISTTLGEGFGLAWLEAMAAKVPIIMPANTMLPEFITEETGWLCKSGSSPSLWTVIQFDNEVSRPLTDVDDLVKILVEMYNNPEERLRRAENAHKWVTTQMDWQKHIAPMWVKLFDEAAAETTKADKEVDDIISQLGKKSSIIEAEEL
jgi:glycosyltransferase involved in cell wall biosynthesis